ncbi:MAG TPA: MBL fold metallo-hydrolase [Gemmatimonadaceae bacterium]|nr:MBL fold metallo-hydrolase [Gemmatimonadaceae bacterium]
MTGGVTGGGRRDGADAGLRIDHVTVGPFEENCYLIMDPAAGAAVLVDPGDEPGRIVEMARRHGARPGAVWLTHAHLDHIGAISGVRRAWPDIPVFLHPLDEPVYAYGLQSAVEYGVPFEQPEPADRRLAEGDVLQVGSFRFAVWHVPGHSPGHVAFVAPGIILGGDCLFAGSVGRTDLPLSDPSAFVGSLERIVGLPPDSVVLPGHGPPTTVARELASNPFLTGVARVPGTARAMAPVSPRRQTG